MAYNEQIPPEQTDEAADTASFRRFFEDGEAAPPADSGRGFRMLSLAVGAVVLIAIVVLLMQ